MRGRKAYRAAPAAVLPLPRACHDRAARDPQFRRAPVRGEPQPRRQGRLRRRPRRAPLRRARRPLAPLRRRAARPRHSPRGARAAADARLQRVAGRVPRRALRRRRAGRRQHAAHRRRLRLHAGAQPRPGGDRLGVARADPAQGDGRGAERSRPRHRRRRPLGASPPAPTSLDFDFARRNGPQPLAAPARDARRRPGVLALFVGIDRQAEGHRPHARQRLVDGRALRQGRARR